MKREKKIIKVLNYILGAHIQKGAQNLNLEEVADKFKDQNKWKILEFGVRQSIQ